MSENSCARVLARIDASTLIPSVVRGDLVETTKVVLALLGISSPEEDALSGCSPRLVLTEAGGVALKKRLLEKNHEQLEEVKRARPALEQSAASAIVPEAQEKETLTVQDAEAATVKKRIREKNQEKAEEAKRV